MSSIFRGKLTDEDFVRLFLGRSVVAFAIKVGSAGLAFVMFVALARAMGQEAYGVFGSAFSLAMLLSVVGGVGQRPVVLRFGAAYHQAGNHVLRRGVTRRGYYIVFAGSIVVGVLGTLIYQLSGAGFDLPWVAAITVLVLVWALVDYQSLVMRIANTVTLSLMPRDIIWRAGISILASTAAAGWWLSDLGPQGWIWLLALSLASVGLGQFLLNERQGESAKVIGLSEWRVPEWNAPVVNLWLSSVILIAAQYLSVVMIERQIGPEQAGPYFAALRTAQLLNLFLFAASLICSPLLSRSIARADYAETQKVCSLTALVGGGFGAVGFAVIALTGGQLLRFYGEGFENANPALLVLAAGFLVNTLAGPTGSLLEMSGHEKAYFRALLWANVLGLAMLPLAIHWVGVMGAALCTAGIAASWNIASVVFCRRVMGIDPSLAIYLFGKPKSIRLSESTNVKGDDL